MSHYFIKVVKKTIIGLNQGLELEINVRVIWKKKIPNLIEGCRKVFSRWFHEWFDLQNLHISWVSGHFIKMLRAMDSLTIATVKCQILYFWRFQVRIQTLGLADTTHKNLSSKRKFRILTSKLCEYRLLDLVKFSLQQNFNV